MPHKKRFCRFPAQTGVFCVEHQPSPSALLAGDCTAHATTSRRMPCPLDPKHTCDASRLQAHLKVCPAKRDRAIMERRVALADVQPRSLSRDRV
jgi:tRNA:m4X modification enzyme